MAVETLYLYDKSTMPNRTPLMVISDWKTYAYLTVTAKTRPYDVEHTEVEIANTTDAQNFRRATHVYIEGVYDRIYKITGIRQGPVLNVATETNTDAETSGSCILALELDALATWWLQTGGPVLYGRWERLPVRKTVEPFQVRPSQMVRDTTVDLPRMTEKVVIFGETQEQGPQGPFDIAFVKITGLISQVLTTLYFVVPLDDTRVGPKRSGLPRDGGGNEYPSLFEIMNFTGQVTGMNTSEIIDVSISQYPPFDYTVGIYQGTIVNYVSLNGLTTWSHLFNVEWEGTVYSHYIYGYIDSTPIGASKSESVSIAVTDGEPGICQLAVKNAEGNIVQSIDPRYSVWDSVTQKWYLNMTYTIYITTSAIMSKLTLPDGSIIEWSEGHLPYNSSRWNDYVLSERQYDREMNMIQRDKAQYDLVTGAVSSLANGAFTASFSKAAAVGTAGLSMVGGIFDYLGGEMVRERQQSAKDALMKAAPNTVYSDAYGISYVIKMLSGEHDAIVIMKPMGVTVSEITEYIRSHGYPVSDYYGGINRGDISTAGLGYIRCTELSTSNASGELYRVLEKQLMKGISFQVI